MLEGLPGVHPALILTLGAVAVALSPRRSRPWLFVVAAALAGLATLGLTDGTTWNYDFYGVELTPLRVDRLSLAFAYVFSIALVAGGVFGMRTMGALERPSTLMYAASAFGVVFAGDLVTLFFFWELKVAGSALLIFARRSPASAGAGMRYLFVSLAGGIVLLGGISWWITQTGSITFGDLGLDGGASALILVGFLISAAAVPLHAWMPDAYPASTVAGTVFLAAFTSKAAIYALARGFPGTNLLIWVGVVMALWGVVFALAVNDTRRMLVYSSVSQGGFMVAAIGVGSALAIDGAVSHAFAHIVYKGLLLMAIGAVLWATGHTRLTRLHGLGKVLPWVAVLYMVGALSIGGIPLLSGFVAKEMSALAIDDNGFGVAYWLLKLASVGTLLVVVFRLPWFTFVSQRTTAAERTSVADHTALRRRVPASMYVAMVALACVNVVIGVWPNLLYGLLPNEGGSYEPFTAYRVTNSLALALGALAAFWVGRRWLAGRPISVRDTDWFYRDLPRRLAPTWNRIRMPDVAIRLPELPRTPVWVSTLWVSGVVVVGVLVTLLAVGMLA